MKKAVLAMFLVAFAGISLAETPEIVNPPRPNKEYKWMVVITHEVTKNVNCTHTTEIHTHFVYTNNYFIQKMGFFGYPDDNAEESKTWYTLVTIGQAEELFFDGSGFSFITLPPGVLRVALSSKIAGSPAELALKSFFIARAPKPASPQVLNLDFKTPSLGPPKHQKAKVVFTNTK